MKVYELTDQQGRVFAFEVETGFFGRRGACRVARRIPGVTIARTPRFLSWFREDTFCEFELQGVHYEIYEPFGDNSRYWVGPQPPRWEPQTQLVLDTFARCGAA